MLKKVVFFTLIILSIACTSYGEITYPCESGNIVIGNPSFPTPANFSVVFTLNNCNDGDETMNGTITASGTLALVSSDTYSIDIDSDVDITVKEGGNQTSVDCTSNITGNYTVSTEKLDGNYSLSCSGSGSVKVDVVDLFLGPMAFL